MMMTNICHKDVNHIISMKKRAAERVAGKEDRAALKLRNEFVEDNDVEIRRVRAANEQ
jgi:hypothetical protein